jgi:hypothetical protein
MDQKAQAPTGIMCDLLDLSRAASALSQKEGYPKQNVPLVGYTEDCGRGVIYFTNPAQFRGTWEALQRAR